MHSEQATILVVDDEPSVSDLLSEDLEEEGYNCDTVATGEDALKSLSKNNFDVLLLDLKLPGISGMDVLKEVKSNCPETAVIVVTAAGDAETAVEAMKIGAVDYITKPFKLERVNSSIATVLQTKTVWRSRPAPDKEAAKAEEEVKWTRYLDDIAEGAETRLDSLIGHVMTIPVIDGTIAVARSLGMPEEQVERWADARRRRIERINILDFLLEKVAQKPVA